MFELDLTPASNLKESHFAELASYQLVVVLSNSLEVEYEGKEHEKAVYEKVQKALKRRSFVGLLKGGSKELFRFYNEVLGH